MGDWLVWVIANLVWFVVIFASVGVGCFVLTCLLLFSFCSWVFCYCVD